MKKVYYIKEGRKYVPVAEYDDELLDSFPKGNHLVMCYPGGSSRRFNIDPNYAAMIAAGRVAEDAICEALVKSSELRPMKAPITEAQSKAWKNFAKEMGDDICALSYGSARDHAEAAIKAMQEEALKLMTSPAVKKAYEHFMLMCELTREHNENP